MHEEPVKLFSPRKSFLMCFFPVQRQFPYINPYFVLALVSVPYWSLVVLFILCGDLLTFWSTQCHPYSSINSSCFQVRCIAELANDFILDITSELVFSCIFLWHFILKWDLLEQLDKYVHPWGLPYEYIGLLPYLGMKINDSGLNLGSSCQNATIFTCQSVFQGILPFLSGQLLTLFCFKWYLWKQVISPQVRFSPGRFASTQSGFAPT